MHIDLCSMGDRTVGGVLYFVIFMDDHSRILWTYSLKSNDQVLDVFKQWAVKVEREIRKKVKCIHSDNGRKYNDHFEIFYKINGIMLEKIISKTPQIKYYSRMNEPHHL
jgi:Integrase core domain